MSAASTEHGLIAYGDYCCPFSYLIWHSLGEYWRTAANPPAVSWRPFDVHYNRRTGNGSLDHEAVETFYDRIEDTALRTADARDVDLDLSAARGVDCRAAHSVALLIENEGGSVDEFHEAAFSALWQDGRDLSDPDVLMELAESVGMDAELLDDRMASGYGKAKRTEAYEEALDFDITATPTLVFNGRTKEGALSVEEIDSFIDR